MNNEISPAPAEQSNVAQNLFGGDAPDNGASQQTEVTPQQVEQQTEQQVAAPAAQPTAQLTQEQIREIVKGTAEGLRPQQPQQTRLTQEQADQMLNVYRVQAATGHEIAASLGLQLSDEQAVKFATVLNAVLDGKTKQAVTMSSIQLEALKRGELSELRNNVTPLMQMREQQHEQAMQERFYSKNPDLKPYESILAMVYTEMKTEGLRFKTEEEAFSAASTRARAVLSKIPGLQTNGQTANRNTNSGAARPAAAASRMSTVSTGGHTGATPNKGAKAGENPVAKGLFGNS